MTASPFDVKICGITSVDDALAAVDAGADALGLNFYQLSRRHVTRSMAKQISQAVAGQVRLIGLFVNHPSQEVNRVAADLQLNWVQLHGDESPDYLLELDGGLSILRAYRVKQWQQVLDDLHHCHAAGRRPNALLVDALVPGNFGGTGKKADWNALAERPKDAPTPPLILAGGLTPENVAQAITTVRPAGVDTASGVEAAPGIKDRQQMQRFVEAAKSAFSAP